MEKNGARHRTIPLPRQRDESPTRRQDVTMDLAEKRPWLRRHSVASTRQAVQTVIGSKRLQGAGHFHLHPCTLGLANPTTDGLAETVKQLLGSPSQVHAVTEVRRRLRFCFGEKASTPVTGEITPASCAIQFDCLLVNR